MAFEKVFTSGKWTVSINSSRIELEFSNDTDRAYAYLHKSKSQFMFDRTIVPKPVRKRALKWAMKAGNMLDFYNE